ncbi:MAG: glycosyltransferase [Acidobacteria bacterium]|nr:glycosyltransferase [Acidobacteriota bacterium]
MRIALVHDWLTGMRGGEKVLEVLCDVYPAADVFTLLHVPGSVSPRIERHRIRTSLVQRVPGAKRIYRQLLPLFPFAIEQFSFDRYDLIVSISHCAAKSILPGIRARHLCYCLTPMRYAWDQFGAYFGPDRVGRLGSGVLRPVMARLARWDAATANRAHQIVAISRYVADRVRGYYNRQASVVYPPVDTEYFRPDGSAPGNSALVVSALVPYKRVDLAIAACAHAGIPLRIVGTGPELDRLRRMAGPTVSFPGWLSDGQIRDEYLRAGVVLLPGIEDFGIVPLEAQACGRPVVALNRGGATETVVDGVTGTLVGESGAEAFGHAIGRTIDARLDAGAIRLHAERFGRARFEVEMRAAVDRVLTSSLW